MKTVVVTDLSKVLLFAKDPSYQGGLNELNKRLLKADSSYPFFDHFALNEELLGYYKELNGTVPVFVFTTDSIQNHPAIKSLVRRSVSGVLSAKELNLSKVDPASYVSIASQVHREPNEVIYIDDKPANIEAAGRAGLKTALYTTNNEIMAKLDTLTSVRDIKHIWFDLDGTLSVHTPEFHRAHDKLRYETYAEATGRPMSDQIAKEYEEKYKKYGTNSAVFRTLGLPSDYWMIRFNTLDKNDYYKPIPAIYETLEKLKDRLPISLFTNDSAVGVAKTLKVINVQATWFTCIINGDEVKERKPHLEGFRLMVAKSKMPAGELLYVGDRVDADVTPAKEVGMQTCLVYSESKQADYSLLRFEDLLKLVG